MQLYVHHVGLVKNQEPYDTNKFRYQYEDYIRKPLARRAVMQTGLERIGLPGKTPFLCSLRWILSRTYRNLSQLALLRRNAFGGSPDDLNTKQPTRKDTISRGLL